MEDHTVPQKLGLLGALVARLGIDPGRARLTGRAEMAYEKTRDHYGGGEVDVHQPRLARLSVGDGEGTFANVAPGSPEFEEAAKALKDVRRMPLFEMLTEKGKPLGHEGEDFGLAWRELVDLVHAEGLFLRSLLDDDDEAAVEAGWIRFRHSGAFGREPCTRGEFESIRAEFVGSRYVQGMDLTHYYGWWRDSEKLFDGDGFNAETAATAERMLDAWKNLDREQTLYWMTRNLNVHPRHRAVTERVVDARSKAREAGAEEEAPASPAP